MEQSVERCVLMYVCVCVSMSHCVLLMLGEFPFSAFCRVREFWLSTLCLSMCVSNNNPAWSVRAVIEKKVETLHPFAIDQYRLIDDC